MIESPGHAKHEELSETERRPSSSGAAIRTTVCDGPLRIPDWQQVACFGPGCRVFVQLAPAGTVARLGSPRGGFRDRPIRRCPIHRSGIYVIERRFLRSANGPHGWGPRDVDDVQVGGGELRPRQGPIPRDAQRVPLDHQQVGAVGRRRADRAAPPQGRPRVPRLGPRAGRRGRGDQPGPHRQQGPRAPPRRPLLGLGAGADRGAAPLPRAQGPARRRRPPLPHQGRDQRPLLRDPRDGPAPWLGRSPADRPLLAGRPGRLLQLRRGHRDGLGVDAGPRADPLAAHLVGAALARPRGQGAVAVGLAVLPAGEDGQAVPPADEPGGPRPPPGHHAGRPATRRPRSSSAAGRGRTPGSSRSARSPASSRGWTSRPAGRSRGS